MSSIITKIEDLNSDAKVCRYMGNPYRAALTYARIAKMCREHQMFDDMVVAVQVATDCLIDAGMIEEASEGLRTIPMVMVNDSQPLEAIRLSNYMTHIENNMGLSNCLGSRRYIEFVWKKCKEKKLLM